jgi:hypothetical protein
VPCQTVQELHQLGARVQIHECLWLLCFALFCLSLLLAAPSLPPPFPLPHLLSLSPCLSLSLCKFGLPLPIDLDTIECRPLVGSLLQTLGRRVDAGADEE